MAERQIIAGARVTVTLEISGVGSWGANCTVAQIESQARESAIGALERLIREGKTNGERFRIVGSPEVKAVIGEYRDD